MTAYFALQIYSEAAFNRRVVSYLEFSSCFRAFSYTITSISRRCDWRTLKTIAAAYTRCLIQLKTSHSLGSSWWKQLAAWMNEQTMCRVLFVGVLCHQSICMRVDLPPNRRLVSSIAELSGQCHFYGRFHGFNDGPRSFTNNNNNWYREEQLRFKTAFSYIPDWYCQRLTKYCLRRNPITDRLRDAAPGALARWYYNDAGNTL